MVVGGIDEAGRGALLGPLVIAGVSLEEGAASYLRSLGVRDSKKVSPEKRERLYPEIVRMSKRIVLVEVPPAEIDRRIRAGCNLNLTETIKMAKVARSLECDTVYVDAVDVNQERFQETLSRMVSGVSLVCEHRADEKYTVTGAASIVAKVFRDRRIRELSDRFGEIGSGYPSDARTMNFVWNYFIRNGELPDIVRRSWKPARAIMAYAE